MESTRLDKWLWAARFYKTRSLAQEAVESGRVRIAHGDKLDKTKPSREVRVGELLKIETAQVYVVHVTAIADKRGPASFARTLYLETADSMTRREQVSELNRLNADPAATRTVDRLGRPTKRDRRELERVAFEQPERFD